MNEWEEIDREFIEKAESLPENRCSRSKHWRLLEGCLVTGSNGIPARVLKVEGNRVLLYTGCTLLDGQSGSEMFWADATPSYYFPVLSDEATIRCLLVLVREAYQCPWLSVVGSAEDGWRIDAEGSSADVRDLHSFGSEAEALVSALEAAG